MHSFGFEKVRVIGTSGWDIGHLHFRNDTFRGTFDNSAQNVVYGDVTLRGFEEYEVMYLGSGGC